jgi:hypothetical protein
MAEHVATGLPQPSDPRYQAYINDTYLASTSDPLELIVQEEQIQSWQEAPLPTQYWTRPINSANRGWYVLAANWLAGAAQTNGPTSSFNYGTGPESAHIMWATPMWAGGIMDARLGDTGYQTAHYEGLGFTPPIILNGKIYYNTQSLPREGWYCLDLYTGKTEYFFNTSGPASTASASSSGSISQQSLAFGQVLKFDCPNQHGGFPYLWSTTAATSNTWMMYDAYTSNYICSIANVSASGTAVYGKDGSILRYNIVGTGANKRLTVWNTTQAIWWRGTQQQYQAGNYSGFSSNSYWMWRPGLNVTYDGSHGFSLNASIPDVQGSIRAVREDQHVIGGSAGSNNEDGIVQGNLWALNLKPGSDGIVTPTLLWDITFTPPSSAGNKTISMGSVDPEDGVFLFSCRQTRQWYGYSLATGQLLWTSEPEPVWSFYGMNSFLYQGMLLCQGDGMAAGELIVYNVTTGKVLWKYIPAQVGFESPYGNYPNSVTCIADGKIYLSSGEHSPTQPLWRGSYLRCVNASNGVELWKVLHWGVVQMAGTEQGMVVIADGFLVGLNFYDNQIYCYGKGPSATTVSASPKVSVHGSSVLIEGTVTDQSPGAKDTPAIADESMQAWMEYLYAKQAIPTNATGVEVTLDTIDPNGNFVHIGTVTSDMSGLFKKTFTPEVPGEYTIITTFAGSKSYWSSYAETAILVSEAPAAPAEPEPAAPLPPYEMYTIGTGIAIIIAVAIVGILLLRKRP